MSTMSGYVEHLGGNRGYKVGIDLGVDRSTWPHELRSSSNWVFIDGFLTRIYYGFFVPDLMLAQTPIDGEVVWSDVSLNGDSVVGLRGYKSFSG